MPGCRETREASTSRDGGPSQAKELMARARTRYKQPSQYESPLSQQEEADREEH